MNGHYTGDWGEDDFCDPGEYAIGFQVLNVKTIILTHTFFHGEYAVGFQVNVKTIILTHTFFMVNMQLAFR